MTRRERRLFGEYDPIWVARFERAAIVLVFLCILAGLLAMVGRYTETWWLASWAGGVPGVFIRPMQVFTAFALVGLGVAVILGLRGTPGPWAVGVARTVALASGAVGLTVFLAQRGLVDVPSWLSGPSRLADTSRGEAVGIPASNEGIMLVLLGVAIVLVSLRRRVTSLLGQAVAVLAAVIGGVVAIAFGFGDTFLVGFPFGTGRMSFSAAITAVAMAGAILLVRPDTGFVAPLTSPWSGGHLLRRILPFVLVLPPAAVALMATELDRLDRPRILAWVSVGASVFLGAGLLGSAASVNRARLSVQAAGDLSDRALLAVREDAALQDELRGLLVRDLPDGSGEVEFAVRYRPAEGWLAGDAAVVQRLDGSRIGVAIIDVAGHGPARALTAFRISDLVLHSMKSGMSPSRAVASVLWALESGDDMATAVVAEVDAATGALRYVVAGHPPVLIRRQDSTVEQLAATGPLLFSGIDQEWDEGLAVLAPEDSLVVYTDGVADPQEAKHAAVASVTDLTTAVRRFGNGSVEELAEWCLAEASGRARGQLKDDATVVVMRRNGIS